MANYPDGQIVSGDMAKNPQVENMYRHLRIYEDNGRHGDGLWEGNRISIIPRGGYCGGNAMTLRPANIYSDILAKKNGDKIVIQKQENTKNDENSIISKTLTSQV